MERRVSHTTCSPNPFGDVAFGRFRFVSRSVCDGLLAGDILLPLFVNQKWAEDSEHH